MATSAVKMPARVSELEFAFPTVDPMVTPLGSRILLQVKVPKKQLASGLIVPDDTADTEKWNTQIAKVVAVGPLAFKNRETQKPWPEGAWCQPGDYVRIAKYRGDQFEVKSPHSDDNILFTIINDLDVIAKVTGDPLKIKAYL